VGKKTQPARRSWLFKEEPTHYSYDDLERDGEALWDGIANNTALKHLREVQPGDRILYYHTGKERAIVGEMVAASAPIPDPAEPKLVGIQVKPARKWKQPVTLERIKQEPSLKEWDLLRISRLSVMPVSPEQMIVLEKLAEEPRHKD
jgi:predicted RNA-binding protein with PUA-like domain